MTLKLLPSITDPVLPLLLDIIKHKKLIPVFQPILDYRTHTYLGFEGLIRGPEGSLLYSPAALFGCAERNNLTTELEYICMPVILNEFGLKFKTAKLFINISPLCMQHPEMANGIFLDMIRDAGLPPHRIVMELTESHKVGDFSAMLRTLKFYRNFGCLMAMDDFGEGFSNLRVWSELRPDFVKLDRHFIDGISIEPLKFHFVKAILELASTSGSRIIAEGIEREDDFLVIRDLNIECGQGFYIAKPSINPDKIPLPDIKNILSTKKVMAFHYGSLHSSAPSAKQLMSTIPAVNLESPISTVKTLFDSNPNLDVIPVIDASDIPVGVVTKGLLLNLVLSGQSDEPCKSIISYDPLIVDVSTSIQELGTIMSKAEKRYIHEGFIVTKNGKYAGIIDGHDLISTITDMQIQSARYANPLSGLPGNVPIEQHIDRIIAAQTFAVVCRIDLNEFKPFNDTFGYQKGDDIIKLLSQVISEVTEMGVDFVGHTGGDDFMVVFQSEDWSERCNVIVEAFSTRAEHIFPMESIVSEGYTAENRKGEPVFYHWPTISVGVVKMNPGEYESHYEVLTAAEVAKQHSKTQKDHIFIERRKPHSAQKRDVDAA